MTKPNLLDASAIDSIWGVRPYAAGERWYVKVLVPQKGWRFVSGVSFDELHQTEEYIRKTFGSSVERRS